MQGGKGVKGVGRGGGLMIKRAAEEFQIRLKEGLTPLYD